MSVYDNDSRVDRLNAHTFVVDVAGDGSDDHAVNEEPAGRWWTSPMIGSATMRAANLRDRDEAEAWATASTVGPYSTLDDAVRSLIGNPR